MWKKMLLVLTLSAPFALANAALAAQDGSASKPATKTTRKSSRKGRKGSKRESKRAGEASATPMP